jgi:hypothetical protein
MQRQAATIERFVNFLTKTNLVIHDPLVTGNRKATHMQLYVPFCKSNREFIHQEYGITWKDGVNPGQKGPFSREFSDNILRQGLRAYHAKQLGKTIDEVPEVRYDEKKATMSKNGKAGTRGILHWRLNENAVTTERNVAPTVTTERNIDPTVTTERNVAPTVTTERNIDPTVPTERNVAPTVTVRHSAKRAAESIASQATSRAYRRKSA